MKAQEILQRLKVVREKQPFVFNETALNELTDLDNKLKQLSSDEDKAEIIRLYCLNHEDVRDAVLTCLPNDWR